MLENLNWDNIIEDIGPRLYRYFCVRFSDEHADDLTQETLLRLVRKVEQGNFIAKKGSLRMYAFGIAHFVSLEAKRSQPALERIEDWEAQLSDEFFFEQQTLIKDAANKVRANIQLLSDKEQQIISLFIDDEISIPEISLLTDIPTGTIKSHLHRAKKKLVNLIVRENVL